MVIGLDLEGHYDVPDCSFLTSSTTVIYMKSLYFFGWVFNIILKSFFVLL